ncbi:hypothetical protein FLA_5153 [Filimonas lacunae]|nr:hypothetical protein FLA_5153 [Filimonas lacunae]
MTHGAYIHHFIHADNSKEENKQAIHPFYKKVFHSHFSEVCAQYTTYGIKKQKLPVTAASVLLFSSFFRLRYNGF